MHRYIAFVWDPQRDGGAKQARLFAACAASGPPGWNTAFEAPGLLVLYSRSRSPVPAVCRLSENRGVVLGRLFRRCDEHPRRQDGPLSNDESRKILTTQGKHLIERYWGTYVAFLWDAQHRRHHVVREPMGNFPCYHATSHGIEVFFSHIQDCSWLLPSTAINRKFLSKWLVVYRLLQRECGLEAVDSVLPGEAWTIASDTVTRALHWNPAAIVSECTVENPKIAAQRVRSTVQSSVDALVADYDRIVHRLSGGLDSSIVAACLARSPTRPRVLLLNSWSDLALNVEDLQLSGVDQRTADLIRATTGTGDERYFARLVADRLQLPLLERQRPVSLDLMRMYEAPLAVSPTGYFTSIQREDVEMDLVQQEGVQAFFSGHAGDNLFLATVQPFPAIDYAFRHGLDPRAWRYMLETAALSRLSVWAVLGKAIRHGVLKRPYAPPASLLHRTNLLGAELVNGLTESDFDNVWDSCAKGLPPGTQNLIGGIVESTSFDHVFRTGDCADHIDPLNTQPVWELMLQIPTYNILLGGVSRGLARTAFADVLPPEIRRRQVKGTGSPFYQRLLSDNLSFVRDALLDGLLVRDGYLDRQKVGEYFQKRELFAAMGAYQIFSYLTAEIWMRQWEQIACRARGQTLFPGGKATQFSSCRAS